MLTPEYSSRFKKDLKILEKRKYNMKLIYSVMENLVNEIRLEEKFREHQLQGNYRGYIECHLEPNWLLIYSIDKKTKEIFFARTGTHSDLF